VKEGKARGMRGRVGWCTGFGCVGSAQGLGVTVVHRVWVQGNIHRAVNLVVSPYLGTAEVLVCATDRCRLFSNSPAIHCAIHNSQYCSDLPSMNSQLTADSTKNPTRKLSNISNEQWGK
jgi:hypothetical protein